MAEEITYFRFLSEVRAFLSKLLKDPIKAQPSSYLKNRDVTRKKLIDDLLKRDVLERHEKILDPTNSEEKEAKYVVKYKVHKKDFEKRIRRLYIKYFEKNVNESVEEMQAYHGSKSKFKRFGEKYISTCFCGWGTYVSTDKKTGQHFAGKDGYIYEVSIPDDNGNNYLDGEYPTIESCKLVYSILKKEFPEYNDVIIYAIQQAEREGNFSPIFNDIGIGDGAFKSKYISKAFLKNGIVGVRWDTTYVLFDAKMVKIVKTERGTEEKPIKLNLYKSNGDGTFSLISESVFANEEEMKQHILDGPDGKTYKERGGINEDGEGGGGAAAGEGGSDIGELSTNGSTNTQINAGHPDVVIGGLVNRPGYNENRKKKKTTNKILGKTVYAESRKPKKIYITEEQLNRILKEEGLGAGGATTTTSVASNTTDRQIGPPRPGCMTFKKSDGSPDNSAFEREPGFSVKHVGDK